MKMNAISLMTRHLAALLIGAALALGPRAQAAPPPDAGAEAAGAQAGSTGEIVVPVQGTYSAVQGPKLDLLSGPITVRREDFNRSNQTLVEVLEAVPGVEVIEFGGEEGPWRVSIRGAGPKQAAVYLDGVLLNDPRGNVPDLSRVPLTLVDEVVVYRGAAPTGYPVGGTSGVIDIRTMPASEAPHAVARGAYDNLDTKELSAGAAGGLLGGAGMIGTFNQWGGGRFDYTDERNTPRRGADDRAAVRTANAFADHDAIVKYEHKLGNYRLYGAGMYLYSERGQPGEDFQHADASSGGEFILAYAGVKRAGALNSDLDAEVRVHYLHERDWFKDANGGLGPPRDDQELFTRFGVDSYLNYYGIPANRLSLYFGLANEDFNPTSHLDGRVGSISARRSSLFLNASDEISLFNDRLKLKPRVRYVWMGSRYGGPTLVHQLGLDRETTSFSTTNADFSVGLRLAPNLWLLANSGQYFRPPDFSEEFGDRFIRVGNPELTPERSVNLECGFFYDLGPMLELDSVRAELSYYHNQLSNRIGWIALPSGNLQADNIGDAKIQGLELGVQFNLRDRLLVEASYSWQDSEDLARARVLHGKELPGVARNLAAVTATLYQSYGRIYYKGYYEDGRWLDEANTIRAAPRMVHSLGIGYYRGRWTVGLEAANLTNDRSREALGYPLPGTRYVVMVEFNQ
jgi:vitamin B12 transporter